MTGFLIWLLVALAGKKRLKGQSESLYEKIILIGIIIIAILLISYAIWQIIGGTSLIGSGQTDPRSLVPGLK